MDSACGGAFMNKTSDQAFDIFETLSENSQQFSTRGFQEVKLGDTYGVHTSGGSSSRITAIEEKLDAILKTMSPKRSGPT